MQTEPITVDEGEVTLPASFAQQRMWFLERFEGGAVYNVPVTQRLRGPLDVPALAAALEALVARHETLRTVFTLVEGAVHQVIRPAGSFTLEVLDLSGEPDAEQRALALAAERARVPFDLGAEEPFRALLVRIDDDDDHLLSLTLHHVATDAWSMGVLSRELAALYAARRDGRTADLPELEIQYADFAVWQQDWLESGGLDAQLHYWGERLAGAPPLLELPTDHPRPARQSFHGATERMVVPGDLMARVRATGDRHGATPFMTLLAAFGALLSRYAGQDDLVIASPVANRSRVELERVIGLFVNTLPLRVDLAGDPSFDDLVLRVREVALGAFSNQDLPFEKLVERLAPDRHLGHAPVAQVMMVMQNAVERQTPLPGVEQEPVVTDRGTAKFDLTLFAADTPAGLRLALEYCTDLFDRATALRILEHYRGLLEAAVDDPGRPVSELPLLGEEERRRVVHEWNETTAPLPPERERPVHELVEAQARRTPAAVAVTFAGSSLTYAQLDAKANRLARHLRALGVAPGVVAAISADRSLEAVAAVLAVLKAGGAYAPIDPNYPPDRVAFMLEDTSTPVLLTQRHLLPALPEHAARVVCLDDWEAEAGDDSSPLEGGATLDDLAYVIYTSGSTGRPKGVAMPHRPLANLLSWQLDVWAGSGLDPCRTLQFASLSFDVAFQELFATWSSGGTLVLVDDALRRDPEALLSFAASERVERLFLPFVALHNLCEAANYLDVTVPGLREVITAGEQLKATPAVRAFFSRHAGCTLVNQYGPTESHVVTAYALAGPPDEWPALPPIGRPIPNDRVYLVDRHRQPVPIGVPGELCIAGTGLAQGYLGRPELTAERFVADTVGGEPGALMYLTGDLARFRPDGEIEYLGRVDHQVKIRGFRVEPGEVEAALREQHAVREALVDARDEDGERRLVAYVVAAGDGVTPAELREGLRRTLPEHMVPTGYAFVERFPVTPNGKVDRAALARLPLADHAGERELVPPRTETEEQLARLWRKVLGVEEVGVHDDFFELGGHSLLAVRLFSELERKLGVRLPLSALFDTSTIAGLAELVERERHEETDVSTLIRLRRGNGETPLFLIAWAGGEVLPYRDLVEHLDHAVPVWGLRAPGVDRRGLPLATVEELAEHYVEEIRRVRPHGPYRLGGFCFSGLVAYEMARRLQEEGESTSTLALIDAYPYRPASRRTIADAGRVQLKAFREAGRAGRREWVRGRVNGIRGRIHRAVYFTYGPRLFARLQSRHLERVLARGPWNLVLVASNLARSRYAPSRLDVALHFFRAERADGVAPMPWETLATRGVDLRPIEAPGITHDSMMHEPHVRLLAAELNAALRHDGAPRD